MSIVNLKCTLELGKCMGSNIEEIKDVVIQSGLDATLEEDVILFDNTFDNSNKFAENFAIFVSHRLPIGHEDVVFEMSGETLDDKYDIVIKGNKVYIQYYDLIKGDFEEYHQD